MCGLCYFFVILPIVTHGKSISAVLFPSICKEAVGVKALVFLRRRVAAFVDFCFFRNTTALWVILFLKEVHRLPPQCLRAPSESSVASGTMWLCPAAMTPKLKVSTVSAGDGGRCPCPNVPTPSCPPRTGPRSTGRPPGTSCGGGWRTETCPWPSSTLSGGMPARTAAE